MQQAGHPRPPYPAGPPCHRCRVSRVGAAASRCHPHMPLPPHLGHIEAAVEAGVVGVGHGDHKAARLVHNAVHRHAALLQGRQAEPRRRVGNRGRTPTVPRPHAAGPVASRGAPGTGVLGCCRPAATLCLPCGRGPSPNLHPHQFAPAPATSKHTHAHTLTLSSMGDRAVTSWYIRRGLPAHRWGSASRTASSSAAVALAGTPYHTCSRNVRRERCEPRAAAEMARAGPRPGRTSVGAQPATALMTR